MSSDRELIQTFIGIVGGEVTEDEAEKYIKMGKNSLEAALNYYFNKKTKNDKPAPQPKSNAFQKLEQGSKKQAHVEKIIKDLRQDFSAREIQPSNINLQKTPDSLKVSKYPNPTLGRQSSSQNQSTTSNFLSTSAPSKSQDSRVNDKQTPVMEREIRSQLSGAKLSDRMEEEKPSIGIKEETNFDESFDQSKTISSSEEYDPNESFNYGKKNMEVEENKRVTRSQNTSAVKSINTTAQKQPKSPPPRSTRSVQKSQSSAVNKVFENQDKNLKRNYTQFEEGLDLEIEEKVESPKDDNKMAIEPSIQDLGWPKFLGRMTVKAHIMGSFHINMEVGDAVQLRREKQKAPPQKKGFWKSKQPAITSGSAIVRVLYKEEEIGKLETEYSHVLAPLLDRNYIFVEATLRSLPATFNYFSSFGIYVDVYLSDTVISKPLTEIFSYKENSKDSEDRMLQELEYTRDSFVNLFDMLQLSKVTETLIKRLPSRATKKQEIVVFDENKGQKQHYSESPSNSNHVEEKKLDIFDPFAKVPQQKSLANFMTSKKVDGGSTTNSTPKLISPNKNEQVITEESADVNYEKLLNLENDDHGDLKLSEPPSSFVSNLHSYQKQALTWMLSREGCNEKLYNRMNDKNRIIHPLWEEYILKDGAHLYFNPYTGQVAKEVPKAAPDCLGGILADEMGLGKTVMIISLLHSHKFDKKDVSIFKKQAEKRKKLENKGQGQKNLASMVKPSLRPAGNLIIVPVTLLAQWESEIELHSAPSSLKSFIYYGDKRSEGKGDLGRFDVVLTTYGILSNESTSSGEKELYKYEWFRIVLDEAHYIKGRTIQTAKAVYELAGIHKWCLSGTPIQNKLDDLFSLIHFLKVEPWSDYVWWNTYINKPNEKGDQIVFQILQTILRPILLRRTKKTQGKDGNLIIQLPEKVSKVEYIVLSREERDFYDSMFKSSKTEFDKFVEEGTLVSHYAHVFELLLRLRQTCDHPYLIFSNPNVKGKENLEEEIMKFMEKNRNGDDKDDSDDSGKNEKDKRGKRDAIAAAPQNENHEEIILDENANLVQTIAVKNNSNLFNKKFIKETIDNLKNGELENCVVCLCDIEDAVITICAHVLCRYCLIKAIEMTSMCPVCRTILTKKDFMTVPRESRFSVDVDKKYQRSSKIESLVAHIHEVIQQNEKCIVFSQFIGMLMLIEHDLSMQGIKFLRLDGSLAQKKRAEILEEFKTNNTIHVFLISLKAGGVGLNLVVANHAFLVDPWWNPAVEEQAIERCHRIGQKKKVQIVRFICKETVEERIVELHNYKKQLFDSTVTFNQEERKAMNAENFKYLMQNYR